ncbi:MAG: ATP-binding protein [Dehalococcoidia bacterium]|nr:ATP-binding protein [Dehalococcoidia bacterium]
MGLRGLIRTLGFQIAVAMSVLIVAISALVVWQVDGILRENEEMRFAERLLLARDQLVQRLETDRELVVTGASVLSTHAQMQEAVTAGDVVSILSIASEYYQRTGTPLQGTPGLQIYGPDGALLVRAHSPLQGSQRVVPEQVRRVLRSGDAIASIRRDESMGLAISGVAPVVGTDGTIVGAVEALTGMGRSFLLAQERLLGVQVLLADDGVIHVTDPTVALEAGAISPAEHEAILRSGTAFIDLGDVRSLVAQYTLTDPDGEELGRFYLTMEESLILAGVSDIRTHALRATAAGAVIAVVLASGLAFLSVRPLRELVDAARRIQANDLDTRVESSGPTEVLDLADALEDLRVAVRQQREAMLSVNRYLASRFDASSASLSETSQELSVMHGILGALGGDAPGGFAGITDELADLDWADGALIALATEEGRLSAAASANLAPDAVSALLATIEGGVRGQRLETGLVVTDSSEAWETAHLAPFDIGGFAVQPMVEPDGVAGIVVLTTRRALRLTPSRTELLRSVALEVAAMLERTELAGEVEENRRIAESVLREMTDGVLVINHADECRVANPAAARILGRSRLELVGRSAQEILPLGAEAIETLRRRARSTSDSPVAPLLGEANGRRVAISAGPFVDADPERAGMMVLLHDLSAESEAERVKQDFVSMVGHELRTPLTLIRTTIDLLDEGDAGALNQTQERIVEVLNANTDRLMALINDLLDMSAIDSGRMQIIPAPLEVVEVVRAVVTEAQPAAMAKQHQFRLDLPERAPTWADRRRVAQVLSNLIGNAIKYTPPGGVITVSVQAAAPWVRVSVQDTGIGIPPEEQAQLFEKFYRTSQGRRTTGGTGLGLAIARSLVELHGGRIWCESDGMTGTTFTFTLPDRRI